MSEHPVLDTAIWTGDGQAVNSFHPLHEPARLPADEEGRARAVSTLQLHDRTSNDSHIDTLVLVTQRAFREVGDRSENVPTLSAAVNILDRTTQRTTASAGFEFGVVDRDVSLCAHTILDQHLRANTLGCLVVLDTADDPRFKYSDLCTIGPYQVRFYAGVAVHVTHNGVRWPVGTLCVFDSQPRTVFSDQDCRMLSVLAGGIEAQLSLPRDQLVAKIPSAHRASTTRHKVDFLKKCMALSIRNVDDKTIESLADKLVPVVFDAQEVVIRQGEAADSMFFIVSLMNVSKLIAQGVSAEEAQERCLRANDVVALERSELLRLSLTDAWPLLDSMPNLWYTLRDLAQERMLMLMRVSPGAHVAVAAS